MVAEDAHQVFLEAQHKLFRASLVYVYFNTPQNCVPLAKNFTSNKDTRKSPYFTSFAKDTFLE